MTTPHRIALLWLAAALSASALAQDTRYEPAGSQIPGPATPADARVWLADIRHWRSERRLRIGYSGEGYEVPALRWTQSSFMQPQMMIEDRYFYDPVAGRYTVDRYLDDLDARYGGIDSVLIWPVYPNIGIDNRNQHDLLADMPGGIPALKEMVAAFHRRNVRVLFPIMFWDQGTRDPGAYDITVLERALAAIGADGINGDTLSWMNRRFRTESEAIGHPLALEPEGFGDHDEALAWTTLSWGYWKYSFVPAISKHKWLEPRHMVNVCARWARNRNDDLQHAFFNGTGYETWENVWGIWNGVTPRDGEAIRRVGAIERACADLLKSADWEPHTPVLQHGVFASRFPGAGGRTMWTLVNRNSYDVSGAQIAIPHEAGLRYFDLWHGLELAPAMRGPSAVLSFEMEANGYGAVLATPAGAGDPVVKTLLARMQGLARRRLDEFSSVWSFLPQTLVAIAATPRLRQAPEGMLPIPAAKQYEFRVSGVEIEGDNQIGVDVQYPWENSPRRHHRATLDIPAFYMDRTPVTNAQFKRFIEATDYRPADDHNFLRDWKNGDYPAGWERKPVTWVSLEDARAYARWAGKRLPHEWEWQYAAQGLDGRLYPWGNEWRESAVPAPARGRDLPPPADADAFPSGASPFGLLAMTGLVWQWTDEFADQHTRAAMLRGGSYYQPQGSGWYFPPAYRNDQHGKYLLMAPAKDRAGTLGFRCVVDTE